MSEENNTVKRVTCGSCGDKIPKAFVQPFKVKKKTTYLCKDCFKMIGDEWCKQCKIKSKTMSPVSKQADGLTTVLSQMKKNQVPKPSKEKIEEIKKQLEEFKVKFPVGCTVKIVGGVYGNPNQQGTVKGFKPLYDNGEWHLFVAVHLGNNIAMKYPKNIALVK